MKIRNIIALIATSAISLMATSCLFEQKDLFDEPSSARMENFIDNVHDVLMANTHGWVMEYYPGTEQAYGGYTYVLIFDDKEVEVYSEVDPEACETSIYKFSKDNGPVLSFDGHNELLHYFATPSSSLYEAMGGDFEFTIMSATKEKVSMIGKRSGNHCDLYPLSAEYTPQEYIAKVVEMTESIHAATLDGTIGKLPIEGEIDLDNRHIYISEIFPDLEIPEDDFEFVMPEGESFEVPFIITPTGIKAYQPMEIGGCTFQEIHYAIKNNIFTNGVFALQGHSPEDYANYDEFLGTFSLRHYQGTATVTIEASEDGKGYILKGLNKNFDVQLKYNKSLGRASMFFQNLGISSGSNYVVWMPWDADQGYITWASDVGVEIYKDLNDPSGKTFRFADNRRWEGFSCNSFLLYEYDGSGNRLSAYKGWGAYQYVFNLPPNFSGTMIRK